MKVKISSSPAQNELEEIDLSSTTRRGHECVVGRSPDSDVVLDSDDVSRLHGKFFYQSGNYYFCDLGSRNGTIINGKILEKNHSCILNDGDIIRIGDFALMLEEDMAFSQQSETVVRIINPSVFSSLQRGQSDRSSEVASPLSESVSQSEEAESFVSEAVARQGDEVENAGEINQNSEEPTFVQPDEKVSENSVEFGQENQINEISDTPVEAIENFSSTEPEYTVVQPRDIFDDDSHENDSTQVEDEEENSDLNEQEIAGINQESTETEADSEEENSDLNEQEIVLNREEETEAQADGREEDFDLNEQEIVSTQEQTEAESGMIEVTNNEYVGSDMANTQEDTEASMSEIASISTSESVIPEPDEVTPEISQETEESSEEEESEIKIAPILEEKRIVLISHETKKSELKELISEHEEFLSYCQTVTWQTYNDYLYRQTGLSVTEDIPPATSGGYQAINSLINSEKIIAVIFLRDLTVPQQGQASEEALLRTCNIREILLANNLPTAQAVIHYLKNMEDS